MGAQAVGMSTVPEVIALRHMGVKVVALSCITNLAAGITTAKLDHAEVEEVARTRREALIGLIGGFVRHVESAGQGRGTDAR
jgi:purine-nucleoside phosphorylase